MNDFIYTSPLAVYIVKMIAHNGCCYFSSFRTRALKGRSSKGCVSKGQGARKGLGLYEPLNYLKQKHFFYTNTDLLLGFVTMS